jgi:hypothetical protein
LTIELQAAQARKQQQHGVHQPTMSGSNNGTIWPNSVTGVKEASSCSNQVRRKHQCLLVYGWQMTLSLEGHTNPCSDAELLLLTTLN